ncbi:vacuolar import and degradation protein [Rutstroemia sp. NJR-2017a BBW]|nr:vacuolar import and degradation protein [Rutstroemia sp. NJR-2017a BBW]
MFMLRNVGKLIFGDTSKESLIELPQGQLYLVRPLSPKGYSELIFRDAAARIRRTGVEFQYQLVVQRAYEEGEEELLDDEDAEDTETAALAGERDEKTFLLDESLHFRSEIREGGEKVLAWRDLSGDKGDLFEFVCDVSIENSQVQAFELTAVHSLKTEMSPVTRGKRAQRSPSPPVDDGPTEAPAVREHPEAISVLAEETAELHLFDFNSGSFIPQDAAVTATVSEDQETITRFQEGLMQALWEQLNEIKWAKSKEDERDYVLEAFQDLKMEDAPDFVEEEEEEEYEEAEDEDDGQRSEHYDSDEDEDDVVTKDDDGNVNSQLAVGYKHDRSFVVRGSKIGVFKHTPNNNLEFSTNISKVQAPNGKLFNPKKNDFSAAATTEKGYIAVASNKGDIRMFDRLGINAKTHIPALGEPIIGLDVSADGRWVLATCRTYLLLIDALQKDGKNEGKLGFEKSFGKDSKPQPRRLGLTPSHVAQFQHETGAPLSFTPARFNTGEGISETSIISATGPFIVTWNMKKVLRKSKDPYTIKRYAEEVKADNFKYGSDKNVIVALPNEVNMVAKQSFKVPTRESIATPSRVGGGWSGGRRESARIGGKDSGRYKLGKEDVVNSPY